MSGGSGPHGRLPRTWLFVPGDNPGRIRKALAAGAEAVVVDLEDPVAADRRAFARTQIRDELREVHQPNVFVRVNGPNTEWFEDDIAALDGLPLAGIACPNLSLLMTYIGQCVSSSRSVLANGWCR